MRQRKSKSISEQAPTLSARELIRLQLRERMRDAMLGMICDLFQQEVAALCGPRYQRHREETMRRGGSEHGSVYWNDQQESVQRPRVRDEAGEVHLESYQALRDVDVFSEEVQRLLLHGVSTRDYAAVTDKLDHDLGLTRSSASRAFKRASQKDLDELNGRDLSGDTYCVLMIDGLQEAGVHLMVALGITTKGRKRVLGVREGATENSTVVGDLLGSLIERHLTTTQQALFVLDGAKALHKAVTAQWGDRAIIQRCQEHKIRNVQDYLPKHLQAKARRRMLAAYHMKAYAQAKAALNKTLTWLRALNEQAANSLAEGLEETLTVHRLRVPELLRKTLCTTNPIESMMDKLRYRSRRVKNWKASGQVSRWAASSLLLHEKRFRLVRGYRQMPTLVAALENWSVDNQHKVA